MHHRPIADTGSQLNLIYDSKCVVCQWEVDHLTTIGACVGVYMRARVCVYMSTSSAAPRWEVGNLTTIGECVGVCACVCGFVHEYRLTFPIGVDHPGETGPTPRTMAAYQMRGTPTTILIDRKGCISAQLFGQIEDLALGAMIQALLSEHIQSAGDTDPRDVCTPNGCSDPSF